MGDTFPDRRWEARSLTGETALVTSETGTQRDQAADCGSLPVLVKVDVVKSKIRETAIRKQETELSKREGDQEMGQGDTE